MPKTSTGIIEQNYELFLEAYRCALAGIPVPSERQYSLGMWRQICHLADLHRVYPMICETVYERDTIIQGKTGISEKDRKKAVTLTTGQATMSVEFLKLYRFLLERGLHPIVMKGIICRKLYPQPEQRSSSDEDLLIPEEQFEEYHKAFCEYGLEVALPDTNVEEEHEVPYCNSRVYIELHKSPFPPESDAYGDLNEYFGDVDKNKIRETIYGLPVYTMSHTDHLFYQICHAYKHFLNCGIGIRLVSDIIFYSRTYLGEIDWDMITRRCEEINALDFTRAIYRIGEVHLVPGHLPKKLKEIWHTEEIDEIPLLLDILEGGVYGSSNEDRLHSSNITLNTISAGKKGKAEHPVLQTLFPSYNYMKRRYPMLQRVPVLLPFAWVLRILDYGKESVIHRRRGNNASEAMRIGNERVALMKRYRMIEERREKGGLIKRAYQHTHTSVFAPLLSPLFLFVCALQYRFFDILWMLKGIRKPGKKEKSFVRKNVTFIIKSFERQKLVLGLCQNINRMYPGTQIVIADDSHEPLHSPLPNVKVIQMPFNSGLSAGLKAALDQVQTPYVMRLDDDELLTRRTRVGKELHWLMEHPEIDLVGFGHITAIRCHSPEFNFEEYYNSPMKDSLRPLKVPHMTQLDNNHTVLAKVANIYLAKTDKLRQVGFDPKIQVIDHHEFFWRAAGILTSVIAKETVVFHRHNPYDRKYNTYRSDYKGDLEYIRAKRNKMVREFHKEQLSDIDQVNHE